MRPLAALMLVVPATIPQWEIVLLAAVMRISPSFRVFQSTDAPMTSIAEFFDRNDSSLFVAVRLFRCL